MNYLVVIAQSNDGHWFIVTDQSEVLYFVRDTQLKKLMRIQREGVPRYNAYRVESGPVAQEEREIA